MWNIASLSEHNKGATQSRAFVVLSAKTYSELILCKNS
jgi:hypothetical protein